MQTKIMSRRVRIGIAVLMLGASPGVALADTTDLQIDASDTFNNSAAEVASPRGSDAFGVKSFVTGPVTTVKLGIDFGGNYNTNLLSAAAGAVGGVTYKPSGKIDIVHEGDDLKIELIGSVGFDRSAELSALYDKDTAVADLAVTFKSLGRNLGGFVPILDYRLTNVTGSGFGPHKATFGDIQVALARDFQLGTSGEFVLSTLTKGVWREAAPLDGDRSVFGEDLTFKDKISEQFGLAGTISLSEVWYRSGVNANREDTSLALKLDAVHKLVTMPSLSLHLTAVYSRNFSNFATARVTQWVIGPSLSWTGPEWTIE